MNELTAQDRYRARERELFWIAARSSVLWGALGGVLGAAVVRVFW